jgi:hypothetical protein
MTATYSQSPNKLISAANGIDYAYRETGERPVPLILLQLEVVVRRHVFTSERPFPAVLDGIFSGISQPDIGQLFSKLAASSSYEQFCSLVQQAQGSAGLMRFLQLDLDNALALDPQAKGQAGRRLGLLRQVDRGTSIRNLLSRHALPPSSDEGA